MGSRPHLLLCAAATCALLISLAGRAEEMSVRLIEGTVDVAPELASTIAPGDRLVIKLYHPEDGIEKDLSYRIVDEFVLPAQFQVGPALDMSRRTKWQAYVVEVFTDKDRDVNTLTADELHGGSEALVPLGTTNLDLTLRRPD